MDNNTTNHDVTNADILEFLRENMVMKEDFDVRIGKVDTKLESLDARLAEIQLEIENIKSRLDTIEKTLKDDTDALASEVVQLKKRVAVLEQQLGVQRATFMLQP